MSCLPAREAGWKTSPPGNDDADAMLSETKPTTGICVLTVCLLLAVTTAWSSEPDYPGFTLTPPAGENWRLVQQNAGSLVWMKRVEMLDASFLVAVLTSPAPVLFDSQESFLAFVEKTKQKNPHPSRFFVHRSEISAVSAPGPFCVSYDTAIEDRSTRGKKGESLFLEVAGLACLHPDAPDRYFDIQYSSRHPADVDTRESELLDGRAFVDGFRFTSPPADGKWALGERPMESQTKETT